MANKYVEQSKEAQVRRKQYNACLRKRRYPTRKAAEQRGTEVYHCSYCDGYHRSTEFAYNLKRAYKIQWKRETRGRHGKRLRAVHWTLDGQKTLCGQTVPNDLDDVIFIKENVTSDVNCATCERRYQKLPIC